ncbi:hypothetical protein CCMSSC00406_0006393 [Pleurotus cornucopiae]|uniref:Uncharacterized protein n=1 Tax=Pleurotus cornucopiae TaxID=5321 RepID=A0ACB7IQ07_PLECO|nr:hypothetical protein CCMSSC00406_0006393 [Pleurotus cornucopiae]
MGMGWDGWVGGEAACFASFFVRSSFLAARCTLAHCHSSSTVHLILPFSPLLIRSLPSVFAFPIVVAVAPHVNLLLPSHPNPSLTRWFPPPVVLVFTSSYPCSYLRLRACSPAQCVPPLASTPHTHLPPHHSSSSASDVDLRAPVLTPHRGWHCGLIVSPMLDVRRSKGGLTLVSRLFVYSAYSVPSPAYSTSHPHTPPPFPFAFPIALASAFAFVPIRSYPLPPIPPILQSHPCLPHILPSVPSSPSPSPRSVIRPFCDLVVWSFGRLNPESRTPRLSSQRAFVGV